MSGNKSGNGVIMEEEQGEYCVATYIRQNSANFERLNSLTESVCHSEEERKLMDKKSHKCYCSKAEYCSSECKEADRKCNYSSVQKSAPQTNKSVSFHRQLSESKCTCKNSDKSSKSAKKKEVKIDMTQTSSSSSIESNLNKNNVMSHCKVLLIVLFAMFLTGGLTLFLCKFVFKLTTAVDAEKATHFPNDAASGVKQKLHYTEPNITSSWLSLNLDQKRFQKGDKYLRWQTDEETTEISLTENDCLQLKRSALYEIVSKITFEIWPKNDTKSIYHNVQLENRRILDKNVITLLPKSFRHRRMLKTSLVLVLREFQAGDVICVNVQDTSLVYESPIDNSLKIIQKL